MHKIIGLATLCLLAAGCGDKQSYDDYQRDVTEATTNKLRYSQDARTGLCFAWYAPGSQYGTMSEVTCSEAVIREIAK